MSSTPVRRPAVSVQACDTELRKIAVELARLPLPSLPSSRLAEVRELLWLDADRWLDNRIAIAERNERIRQGGEL